MSATVEFSDDAQRMLDGADEIWIEEHGYLFDNPLIEQAERATEQLARIQIWVSGFVEREASDRKFVGCCSLLVITSTTASMLPARES